MAEITDRLDEPDNIEVIRDQIGAILSTELQNQYRLAVEDGDSVAHDYDATVYVDNDDDITALGDENEFPIVCITLDNEKLDSASSVNSTNRKATFYVDCYQTGNYYDGKFAGRKAKTKAWKLSRVVRAILESDQYTYLFLRGIVSQTRIVSRTSGRIEGEAAMKVAAVRMVFEVKYDETAPQTTGVGLKILPVTISDENGQVVIDITEEEDA